MDYPSNSHKKKDDKEVTQVVEGAVTRRKKPLLGKMFSEIFVNGETPRDVWAYVMFDVIVPSTKNMIVDSGKEMLERMFFGEDARPRRSSKGGTSYMSYNKMYRGGSSKREESRPMSRRAKAAHDFDEIILDDRAEAESVLDRMFDLLDRYDLVTVADLYGLVGTTASHVDDKWGWTSLKGARASRIHGGGYLINLPEPEPVD